MAKTMKPILVLLLLSAPLLGQTFNPAPTHNFFDKPARFSLAASAAVYSTDIALTCHDLGHGNEEIMLPVKSCGSIAAWMASTLGVQTGVAYWLHRKGHHRLERIAETFWASGSVAGIGWSLTHRPRELPPAPANPKLCLTGATWELC